MNCLRLLWQWIYNRLPTTEMLAHAAEELKISAMTFEGLYEPINQLGVKGSNTRVVQEFQVRAERYPALKVFVAFLVNKKASEQRRLFLKCFYVAGIRREKCEKEVLIATEKNVIAYHSIDGRDIQVGEIMHILKPAWYQGNKIVDYGIEGKL